MPIFCAKSVKIYTGQKKFTRVYSWLSWQISGMRGRCSRYRRSCCCQCRRNLDKTASLLVGGDGYLGKVWLLLCLRADPVLGDDLERVVGPRRERGDVDRSLGESWRVGRELNFWTTGRTDNPEHSVISSSLIPWGPPHQEHFIMAHHNCNEIPRTGWWFGASTMLVIIAASIVTS